MREIKFRAWDVTNSTMFFAGYNNWKSSKIETHDYLKLTLDGVVVRQMSYSNDPSDSLSDLEEEMSPGTYVLMQFTGLVDKNGKEIYDGDIVEWSGKIYQVKWHDKIAGFVIEHNGIDTWIRFPYAAVTGEVSVYHKRPKIEFECEIIGNIYENPELIQN